MTFPHVFQQEQNKMTSLCTHQKVTTWRDPSEILDYLQCYTCGAKFRTYTEWGEAMAFAKGERGATPGTKMPDTRARATESAGGWKVIPGAQELSPGMLAGYHYAEGPGDLRIRTNDRPLLDRILWLLQLSIDPANWPPKPKRPEPLFAFHDIVENGDGTAKLVDPDPDLMRRVAAKAGVDLGGNQLPERADEIKALRSALEDLVSWFDGGPTSYGPYIIKAGDYGADAAIATARQVLKLDAD